MSRKRGRELPVTRRAQIITLHNEGNSYPEILAKTGVPPSVACKTVKRWETYGTLASLPQSGRPRKFSPRLCRLVIRTLLCHCFEPYSSIATRVGNGLTAVQVKYIAQSRRYRRYVARRKPFLDKNWDEAIWTDELQLGTGNHSVHPMVTRKPGEAYLPECLAPTFQSGHEALMVWGCISHGYKGPLIQLEMAPRLQLRNGRWRGGGFNSEGYVMQVLNGPLKDFIAQMEKVKGHRMLVVEDGAPAHKGKLAKQACEELGIKHIAHPPSSPDLNPIEPLWMELKRRVYSTPGARRSLEHLWNATEAAWKSFTADDINKYTRKMPSRVTALVKSKGLPTKF
ncbi:DDE superfamily endonuclease [Rhizoctonia solani]|uniref:DDE superfamily endonuclease n=1 Tax=Rhizoctonia solani TaxID=456999 RepID=A0A8H8NSY3_9AGAM|nr:DDE superfamily endonuclease [Rhizoctonia solani]QRW18030.1 DDE superfamily endonuclease [Rhizoctonia solani]